MTRIPTQAEYVADELRRAHQQIQHLDSEPLEFRMEAQAEWEIALRDPKLIAERTLWLINGSYGFGVCLMAKRAAKGRGNKAARVGQLLAAIEWHCPANMARKAWLSLPEAEQNAVNAAILKELESAEWATDED